jgi:hypothetical protein
MVATQRDTAGARAARGNARAIGVEHDPEKWIPVFGKRSCSNNKLERDDDSKKSHHALADWLCLAAAPTFAIMALLTGVFGGGPPDVLCSAAQDASPLSGMVPMYLLMSAFHSAPWLRLIRN